GRDQERAAVRRRVPAAPGACGRAVRRRGRRGGLDRGRQAPGLRGRLGGDAGRAGAGRGQLRAIPLSVRATQNQSATTATDVGSTSPTVRSLWDRARIVRPSRWTAAQVTMAAKRAA